MYVLSFFGGEGFGCHTRGVVVKTAVWHVAEEGYVRTRLDSWPN
jgi:hypothetical protein